MAKTRKARTQKKHGKVLTIPELRSSMEHMDNYSHKLVSTKSLQDGAKLFASEWKRVFGKQLSPKAAEDYLKNKMKLRKHGKTRRHRGGAILTGAPLEHITRSGDYIPAPAAIYPPLVAKGFWNPEPAILQDSAAQKTDPYPNTGSNKAMAGGGILNGVTSLASAALFRPYVAQNPITTLQSNGLAWKGLPTGPGADSYDNPKLRM
jgi:hypothetical protein